MKAVVRPLEGTCSEVDLLKIRIRVRPHDAKAYDTDWQSRLWCWLGTHPLADQMHRWVVATEEGEGVGHLAALPQFYRISHQRVVAHTPADYMVRRSST